MVVDGQGAGLSQEEGPVEAEAGIQLVTWEVREEPLAEERTGWSEAGPGSVVGCRVGG